MLDFVTRSGIEFKPENKEYLEDLWVVLVSREASIAGRREVLSGKAKFGILGDGKELPQIAMSKAFLPGDYRAGYYRDQTFMMHKGLMNVNDFFAQLYADSDRDSFSKGRQMNNHFSTPFIDSKGEWLDQTSRFNVSSDISCTAAQMARAYGIAMASKKYKKMPDISDSEKFSKGGNEICFCTIGESSTSEGAFWETLNAAAVNEVPLAVVVWDNGYGISVPKELQTTKGDISSAIFGLQKESNSNGIIIYKVKAGSYTELIKVFKEASQKCRIEHVPVLIHVIEVTQPLGHSTSGSHERYKSKERLQWEKKNDPTELYIEWLLEEKITDIAVIETLRENAKEYVKSKRIESWNNLLSDSKEYYTQLSELLSKSIKDFPNNEHLKKLNAELKSEQFPTISIVAKYAKKIQFALHLSGQSNLKQLFQLIDKCDNLANNRYHTHLHSESQYSALNVKEIPKTFSSESPSIPGYMVLNTFFQKKFEENQKLLAFGEDVGFIGDVNQGFAGLQEKFGSERVFDTGIREWTIIGEAIGLAMRGFRPIAEIQYLDYLIYAHSPLSDDLATLRYRTGGTQKAPAIIRTRGHRLEGIWHAGSPMGMLINSLKGIYLLTPRNMVQAVGMYNTMLLSDDPALIVECLNGYRLKETMPDNIGEFTVPIGKIEILNSGSDITVVTYGSMVREVQEAMEILKTLNISIELIDIQSLMPFDIDHEIINSIKKTNKLIIADEDVPGGASAYIIQKIMEEQGAFQYLDHPPMTITSYDHRPPYGNDGDYFSKPNSELIVDKIYDFMHKYHPVKYKKMS